MATIQDLNKTLTEHGYAIIATPDAEEAAQALARAARNYLVRGEDVRVIDGDATGSFNDLVEEGAILATTPHAANRILDQVQTEMSRRRKRIGNQAWADMSKSTRPDRLVVFIDAYEALTHSTAGRTLRLAEKAAKVAGEGAGVGIFLIGFLRTVDPAEVAGGLAA